MELRNFKIGDTVVQKNDNNSMFYSISYAISSLNNNNEQNIWVLISMNFGKNALPNNA